MKKNLLIIFWIVVIIVSYYFVYKNWNQKEEIKINGIQVTSENEAIVVADSFETKVLMPNNDHVKFDVKYPYFKNADTDFNLNIETLIKNQMADHVQTSVENWQARFDTQLEGENIPKTPIKDDDKFTFYSTFDVIQSNSSYVSFILRYGGFSGGAHGYENNVSFNYDVKNHKLLGLKDLFLNDSQYLNMISKTSRVYLKKQFATVSEEDKNGFEGEEAIKEYVKNMEDMIDSGTDPKEENFSVFTFTPDKIKIYFAQYQVGPYAMGMPEIEIDRR
jgi:hypothetical protein